MIIYNKSNNKLLKKGLYLVPTPIGNLGDITLRAINVLKESNYILCEDTRISKNLLEKYEIKSKLISYYKFNEKKKLQKIIDLLKSGNIISIISDAGTPTISDPGAILVRECIKNKIDIVPLPGSSSISTAVSVSGYSEKFFFYGFFPEQSKKLSNDLSILSEIECSIIFFISSKKLNKVINDLKHHFSGRQILICREMTKMYEEFLRYEIDDLEIINEPLKGELTLVISERKKEKNISQILNESDKRIIREMINKLSIKEISNLINTYKKIPKKLIYDYCLQIKKKN